VSYQVVFAAAVTGVSVANFSVASTTGASVAAVSGAGTTYTVTVNTGSGNGTLRLDVNNSMGLAPAVTSLPYTSGTSYTITKSFAANPRLVLQALGSASGNSDVTAFVDVVQVLQGGTPVVGALQNASFESNNVSANGFLYQSSVVAAPWSFEVQAGVARSGSGFTPTPPNGDAVAFLQSGSGTNGRVAQNLAVPAGSYQVSFLTAQRDYSSKDQVMNVLLNDVLLGTIQPPSTGTYTAFTSPVFDVLATPLPVELTTFTATAAGPAAARLTWATASELNSAAFEVERSTDGKAFVRLATVAAAGSSSSLHHYEWLDAQLPGAVRFYYRLRQVDKDGTASYSPVRAVASTQQVGLALFPNPTTQAATLTGAVPGTSVTVLDARGRLVLCVPADSTGTAALVFPTSLPAGVYVVRAGQQALRLAVAN